MFVFAFAFASRCLSSAPATKETSESQHATTSSTPSARNATRFINETKRWPPKLRITQHQSRLTAKASDSLVAVSVFCVSGVKLDSDGSLTSERATGSLALVRSATCFVAQRLERSFYGRESRTRLADNNNNTDD